VQRANLGMQPATAATVVPRSDAREPTRTRSSMIL
jgi:hypothetical protein